MKKALIFQGGWDGHEPVLVSERFRKVLAARGFDAEVTDSLDTLVDGRDLTSYHLLIPCFTMSEISKEQCEAVSAAVGAGTGLCGFHGGMCDSFRTSVHWQFMTGGNWVAHPGGDGVEYKVNIKKSCSSPIIAGIEDFTVKSEQYYLHVDPAVDVLATTNFPVVKWYHSTNGEVAVPVMWTKRWGHGRVFYSSLGHHDDVFDIAPVMETAVRGLLWTAEGKDIAVANNLSADEFASKTAMF